jgi:cysteine desulfurase
MNYIYLDNNATTPCAPEVVDAMLPFLRGAYGNPASPHVMGRQASAAVARAREQVAALIGCGADEIVFTGGVTESNNLVLHGVCQAKDGRRAIVTSAIEHKAVLGPCEQLNTRGFPVFKIPVDQVGRISLADAESLISDCTLVVSVQAANNEVGTIQPLKEVAGIAHERGALVHSDAAQVLGKTSLDVRAMDVDYASFGAHKVYGPKGIGALYVRGGPTANKLLPVFAGGGQEGGLRPGTLNVPGIVGMGEACRLARQNLVEGEAEFVSSLRDHFEETLANLVPDAIVNGCRRHRLPGTSNVTIPGIPADVLIANVPRICFSSGAACTSGTISPSHVLLAMGLPSEQASCSVRFSVGRYNSHWEVEVAVSMISDAVRHLRHRLGDPASSTTTSSTAWAATLAKKRNKHITDRGE